MEDIRDFKGRLACKGDAGTGLIESVFKGCRTRTRLPFGEVFTVERDGIVTDVTRLNDHAFHVESSPADRVRA